MLPQTVWPAFASMGVYYGYVNYSWIIQSQRASAFLEIY